jgi:hypothetical protein
MKRKIKIDNLITQDKLAIFGQDWISTAMGLERYENQLALLTVDDPIDFEIELEVDEHVGDVMLRVRQQFYIPLQVIIPIEQGDAHISVERIADHIY